ncbi:MAG: aspartyl/glutamyl-tRNA amidotransferase subunit A, partial [Candidatus Eisenbacteria sp.]|nr:aspartyl/glutamyl-tRNA amidotransferase subunit A [Candidatus Eisenbacteria bacterium]
MPMPPGTIEPYVAAVRERACQIPEAIDAFLERISQRDKQIGSLLHVMSEDARQRAEGLQIRVGRGDWPGPLTGVPVVVKDNISVRDQPMTAGSRILEGFRPIYDATAVQGLLEAGAIIIGKANMDEFAMGSSNEFSAYFPVRNPYDQQRVPGGSSGGSAASVAAGLALGSLGSDTGGSVRQPAAFCGLVALKPQYGTVSRYGLIAFGSSLDQIGPMARTARDCALLYNAISGHDPRDSTTLQGSPKIQVKRLGQGLKRQRLGIPQAWLEYKLDGEVRRAFERCCDRFRELGAEITPVELPDPQWGVASYYILANAEASSNLSRYDGVRYGTRSSSGHGLRCGSGRGLRSGSGREIRSGSGHELSFGSERSAGWSKGGATGSETAAELTVLYKATRGQRFGPEVKRRILLGTYVLSAGYYDAYYHKALKVRAR